MIRHTPAALMRIVDYKTKYKMVSTRKIFTSSTTKVDSEPQNGSNDDITNQYECKQTLDVSVELGIHDHNNEQSSSKMVPKVVPPADKTTTSRQELELLFHHHITMLRLQLEPFATQTKETTKGNPQLELQEKRVTDSGCSRHMTRNKSYLSDYKEIDGGFIAFRGDPKRGRITGKGKISTGKLDFEDVYFVKELKFNLFSVSQMCDKKNNVLFIDTGCVVLSPDFKLLDEKAYLKVKVIRYDNGTEFKNKVMNQLCEMKGIKREFSVARTPQQNGVAEKKNRTLIEAARIMLAD
ncbi:ribonuclease H-like domain-containing protein [Tanacetum coccineum]